MIALRKYNLQRTHKGELHRLNFKIILGHQKPLLLEETCSKMGLITINNIKLETPRDALVEEYEDFFKH